MKTLFFTILIGIGLYIGYRIVSHDRILGPRIVDLTNEFKVKFGFIEPQTSLEHCAMHFISPSDGDEVTAPTLLSVVIDNSNPDCSWTVFEGQGGLVKLIGDTDQVIYTTPLLAQGEWMTASPVTYTAELEYSNYVGPLKVLITEENPSGEGIPDKTFITLNAQ